MMMIIRDVGWSIGHSIYGHTFKMTPAIMVMILSGMSGIVTILRFNAILVVESVPRSFMLK